MPKSLFLLNGEANTQICTQIRRILQLVPYCIFMLLYMLAHHWMHQRQNMCKDE